MTQAGRQASEQDFSSALLDEEVKLDSKTLSHLDADKFARYALIGDAMRSEQQSAPCIDITSAVAAAIADEPVYQETSDKTDVQEQKEHPQSNVVSISKWKKPLGQIAIAASVSVMAIMGVNTMNVTPGQSDMGVSSDVPLLQSSPFVGSASPVSFSSEPALQSAERNFKELQQRRIGALVLEHQRQSRMAYALQKNNTDEAQSKDKPE